VNQSHTDPHCHDIHYFTPRLIIESTALVSDETVVCACINDCLDENVLASLQQKGGKLIDTKAIISALKAGEIGLLGQDVYEEEAVFYEDLSSSVIQDDQLSRLLTFLNVIVTSHQAFFTKKAMLKIAQTTLSNIIAFEKDGTVENPVDA
jgi:hypothetical protein